MTGILCTLLAITTPVFLRSREAARRTVCLANLCQIGAALTIYTTDYDGTFPPTTTSLSSGNGKGLTTGANWSDLIAPEFGAFAAHTSAGNSVTATSSASASITGDVFPVCPDHELPGSFSGNTDAEFSGYAYNSNLSEKIARVAMPEKRPTGRQALALVGAPESSVRFPSLTVAVEEARTGIIGVLSPDDQPDFYRIMRVAVYGADNLIAGQTMGAVRHAGGANYLFVDGHARWYRPTELSHVKVSDGIHPGLAL